MTLKLTFLDDLLSNAFGQYMLEHYHIAQHIHQSNLSEVLLLQLNDNHPKSEENQKYDQGNLILKVVHKSFGCTLKSSMYDANHYLPPKGSLYQASIAQIIDYFETDNYIYIVKKFYEGTDLQTLVEEYGPLSLNITIDIGVALLDALYHLHHHEPAIIVRDLKPANVLLTPSCMPILVDLESSRVITANNITGSKGNDTVILGTPGYAAPEQYGIQESNAKSDYYSLGMLLYFLMTGEIKHHLNWHPSFLSAEMNGLRQCIEKATAFDPNNRYDSILSFRNDLMGIKGHGEKPKLHLKRKHVPILALTICILVVSSFALGYGLRQPQSIGNGPDDKIIPSQLPTETETESITPKPTERVQIEANKNSSNASPQPLAQVSEPQVYLKGTRTSITTSIDADSESRELPFGLVQRIDGGDFSTTLVISKLPESLKHVDAIGVGGDINSFEAIKKDIDGIFDRGEDPYREYAAFGSDVIVFRSTGAYYHGHHVDLYEGKRLRAIISVGIDNTIAYIIYP